MEYYRVTWTAFVTVIFMIYGFSLYIIKFEIRRRTFSIFSCVWRIKNHLTAATKFQSLFLLFYPTPHPRRKKKKKWRSDKNQIALIFFNVSQSWEYWFFFNTIYCSIVFFFFYSKIPKTFFLLDTLVIFIWISVIFMALKKVSCRKGRWRWQKWKKMNQIFPLLHFR